MPPFGPGSRIGAGAGSVLVLDRAAATAMAQGMGLTGRQAVRAWGDGLLIGLTAFPPDGAPVSALCRIDHGTASAELHLCPRGAAPDGARVAPALAALGARLLDRFPDLRRVGVTVPEGHPVGAALLSAGFADEGWAPPVRGTGDSQMLTLLRG